MQCLEDCWWRLGILVWFLEDAPLKTNMYTQNDGLEKVTTQLKNGNVWYLLLDFWGVMWRYEQLVTFQGRTVKLRLGMQNQNTIQPKSINFLQTFQHTNKNHTSKISVDIFILGGGLNPFENMSQIGSFPP